MSTIEIEFVIKFKKNNTCNYNFLVQEQYLEILWNKDTKIIICKQENNKENILIIKDLDNVEKKTTFEDIYQITCRKRIITCFRILYIYVKYIFWQLYVYNKIMQFKDFFNFKLIDYATNLDRFLKIKSKLWKY